MKLKAGLAKKSLNKLEILSKLNVMMQEVFQSLMKTKEIPLEQHGEEDSSHHHPKELEQWIELFSIEEITAAMPFGDVRPSWARSCNWWDLECDKHLILGVFKHGYGQYDAIKDDEQFVFKRKLAENLAKISASSSMMMKGNVSSSNLLNSEDKHHSHPAGEDDIIMDEGELPLDMLLDEDDAVLLEKIEDGDDVDDDQLLHGSSGGMGKSGAHNTQPGYMPDPRHLNRIVSWLVTDDTARLSQEEVLEKDKRDRKARVSEGGGSQGRTTTDTPSIDEQQQEFLLGGDQSPMIQMAKTTFEVLKNNLDVDAIGLVFKQQIQALKKCAIFLENVNIVLDPTAPTKSDTSMDIDESNESMDGNVLITDNDAMQLGATFILFGAPIEDNQYSRLYPIAREMFGMEGEYDRNISLTTSKSMFSWKSVKRMSKVAMSEGQIEYYFTKVWLPFCQKLMISQQIPAVPSPSLDKTIPSPFVAPNDHNMIARGLCQLSLLRQQTMYAINYILTNHFKSLLDYLRDNRGRSVDNMPVWWCPWIHDLALLLGILKHGYLATEKIFADPELPFHREYLINFVRKVFLLGTDRVPPVGKYDLRHSEEAERFVLVSASHYPDTKELEVRIFRIVEELTSHLSADHLCKVFISSQTFRAIISQASSSNNLEEVSKTKSDTKVSRNILRGPTISLNAFVSTSRKRRRAYVVSYHPELTSDK
jgi:hypothetical protein